MDTLLSEAKEAYERKYELKRRGYDVERIAKRVAEVCGVEEKEVFSKGRQQKKVKARSLLCYWAIREAVSLRTVAKRLRISAPMVGYAVERGEAIVQESHYELIQ